MSSSEEISLHDAVLEDDPDPFDCNSARPAPKTCHLTGFTAHKLFSSLPASQPTQFRPGNLCAPAPDPHRPCTWGNGDGHHHSADDSDDDDDREGDGDGAGEENNNNISINSSNNNNSTGETLRVPASGNADKIGDVKVKHHSSFRVGVGVGARGSREVAVHDSCNLGQAGRESIYQNAVIIAEPDGDIYYSNYLQGVEGSSGAGEKDAIAENGGGAGYSGRKDVSFSCESGESLRAILSDPVTGALMDDAVILPCGHSFGAGGIQHVRRMKACYTCSQSVSEDQVAANLSLQAVVQAFCQEEELRFYRSSKRRKKRFDQDKGSFGDSNLMDNPRGRGVQFPFSVTDQVIIKGNKRTPQRFVGREAVVTTQCLNGWYVVKTLDNAESVKLQYRSLAKVPDDPSSKPMSSKMARNWV